MIQLNEVRVGNWIKGIALRQYHQVDAFFFHEWYDHIHCDDDTFGDWYEGILLTPDILEKCGFTKPTWNTFTYDFDKLSICLPGNHYRDGRVYFNSWCIIEGSIKSLHQLQNLYYALTQTELKIQL